LLKRWVMPSRRTRWDRDAAIAVPPFVDKPLTQGSLRKPRAERLFARWRIAVQHRFGKFSIRQIKVKITMRSLLARRSPRSSRNICAKLWTMIYEGPQDGSELEELPIQSSDGGIKRAATSRRPPRASVPWQ